MLQIKCQKVAKNQQKIFFSWFCQLKFNKLSNCCCRISDFFYFQIEECLIFLPFLHCWLYPGLISKLSYDQIEECSIFLPFLHYWLYPGLTSKLSYHLNIYTVFWLKFPPSYHKTALPPLSMYNLTFN